MDFLAILVALVFGAISLFTGKDQEVEKNPRPVAGPKPTPTPSGRTYQETRSQERDTVSQRERKDENITTAREATKEHTITSENSHVGSQDITKSKIVEPSLSLERRKEQNNPAFSSISMKKQLKQKRIVESLIMNEVLSSPRAHNPYRSNYQRKIK
ncbi:hypothetical protein [Salinibacillus xinjiangensis]|uniref:Uncharacterized protein n=1 Tax=Salinibacillus xinjiangensis TaxID=1229268 RepID=A0A6G1X6K4_9BACI|nr:hypothetical protein [Salinibacillus xinjiangensis]MRG86633.1 hypothetical protein [Salinibacillus xinjiangensis]